MLIVNFEIVKPKTRVYGSLVRENRKILSPPYNKQTRGESYRPHLGVKKNQT